MWFEKTKMQARQLQSWNTYLQEVYGLLQPWSSLVDVYPIEELCRCFQEKAKDFFRQDRKLNLAVMGQLKAGKSSFLNMLLFDGENVLPKDATPKTATVTKIEYASQITLEVEYYSPEEWQTLEALSRSDANTVPTKSARELVEMAIDSGVDTYRYTNLGRQTMHFQNRRDLTAALDRFVGEDGNLAPVTKSVTIGLDAPELQGVSIVDTPGLNDPIRSRSEKTRAFMEKCDAVFFLSRSSYFLDCNDIELLTSWLPLKGVKELVLVASQFDSALMDTLHHQETLGEAIREAQVLLRRHSAMCIDRAIAKMQAAGVSPQVIRVVEQGKRPLFVSVMAEGISRHRAKRDSPEEALVRKALSRYGQLDASTFREMGGFDKVRKVFHQMLRQKDDTLSAKANAFVVVAQSDLQKHLEALQSQAISKKQEIETQEKPALLAKSQEVSHRLNTARKGIITAFQTYLEPLDDRVTRGILALQRASLLYSVPVEKQDVQIQNRVNVVSESKFYLPWTWGKQRREYAVTQKEVPYLDVVDVAQQLHMVTEVSHQVILETFSLLRNTAALENALCAAVEEISPLSQQEIRNLAAQTIRRMEVTLPQQSCIQAVKALETQFPQRLHTPQEQDRLRQANGQAVSRLIEEASDMLTQTAQRLRDNARHANGYFTEQSLRGLSAELGEIAGKIQDVQQKISRFDELLECLHQLR